MALCRETLESVQHSYGPDAKITLLLSCNLATALRGHGDLAAAEAMATLTLEKQKQAFGADDVHTLVTAANLSVTLGYNGKHDHGNRLGRHDYAQQFCDCNCSGHTTPD